jgi:transglutaminase-like putative cysteine protease
MRSRPTVEALNPRAAEAIESVLDRFGPGALRVAASAGTRIVLLRPGESYRDRSRALRRFFAPVDAWPVPPAGVFVVEERTVYLRSISPMTVAHEFAHALDCALGGGVYLSAVDPRVRRAFHAARKYVTPYAASGLDEYFAESLRAWVEANDPRSPWPRATRKRLREIDPAMAAILESIFRHDLAA